MSRCKDAPFGFQCPYRHQCPHLDTLSTTWVMEVYQESFDLRNRLHILEADSQRRIEELQKTLLERDQTIAQLRLQQQKHFKANKTTEPVKVEVRRRGAPLGHPPWRRRQPDHVDQVIEVPAPLACPHCQCDHLLPSGEVHTHVQEDIVLVPRTRVIEFRHQQCICPICRRAVYQTAPGELRHCDIGPVTRALATYLRYNLQIPYRKVQDILGLLGMSLVHATAMNFDRKTTALGRPLYEELRCMLQSSDVAYADETSWREDGEGTYLWSGGNEDIAFYEIADRSAQSALALLGNEFAGALVTDDYQGYNAVEAKDRQTCWNHLRSKAKEIVKQIELTDPPIAVPRAIEFCEQLRRFAVRMCLLGRQKRSGKLSLRKAKAMIPSLRKRLRRFAAKPLDHKGAETLRHRVIEKDFDKLFTFLRIKGVDPTNNHGERSLRFLVIMRKICFGTRSAAGSQSHGVLPSLLQTAKLQGKSAISFLLTLLTGSRDNAKAALFADGS